MSLSSWQLVEKTLAWVGIQMRIDRKGLRRFLPIHGRSRQSIKQQASNKQSSHQENQFKHKLSSMVIPQFGMINALSRYRWSDKLELMVVYSISILGASSFSSTSLMYLWVLCSLHLSLSPSSSLVFHATLLAESKNSIRSISLSLPVQGHHLSFVDGFIRQAF